MPISYKKLMQSYEARPYLLKPFFGLERESHRVDIIGKLASTCHPKKFGSRSYHPYIQTDFAETQLELITPVFEDEHEASDFLKALYDVSIRNMEPDELIWPISMPPMLPFREEDIPLAQLENPKDVDYRKYLTSKYGKRKQMVSGIHYNFEFADELIKKMYQQVSDEGDYVSFKEKLYMKVARQYLRYTYLITYLFGASPRANSGYFTGTQAPKQPVRSIRNSSFGYKNDEDIFVRFDSLKTYYSDLEELVKSGKLSEMKEFYSAVRIRGRGKLENLLKSNIHYLELRNLDLDPFEKSGISGESVKFIHLFMLFLLWKEEKDLPVDAVIIGEKYNNMTALENPNEHMELFAEAKEFFREFRHFAYSLEFSDEHIGLIKKDRKSTRLNSSHSTRSRMPSSA
jgi:glutamate--cysteine ligase